MKKILVVDDDPVSRELLEEVLRKEGYEVFLAPSAEAAICRLEEQNFTLVLSDIRMEQKTGFDLLREIKANALEFPPVVVLMTGFGSMEGALNALREGAFDYISKPFQLADLRALVSRAMKHAEHLRGVSQNPVSNSAKAGEALDQTLGQSLIGRSPKIVEVYRTLARASLTSSSVLISGESGTGKALVARAIHDNGSRRGKPFVKVSSHEEIIALEAKPDIVAGGTILLEEIESLNNIDQSKLLRLMEAMESARLGVRWIATTRAPVDDLAKNASLREDLLDRLNIILIEIPPLRSRIGDLPELVSAFLAHFSAKNVKVVSHVSESAMTKLCRHSWPGNVRELERTLERAVALSAGMVLEIEDFPNFDTNLGSGDQDQQSKASLEVMERAHIIRVLDEAGYNKSKASEILGIDRATLYRKAKVYGIELKRGGKANS